MYLKSLSKENSLNNIYAMCTLCPRNCRGNRLTGQKGICGADSRAAISSYNLHFGEEPPISGQRGSGAIFFGNCSLRCVFCQNYPISQLGKGLRTISSRELSKIMLELQERGAQNINLVTPSHYLPSIVMSIFLARESGLSIPIVYNSSGYEKVSVIRQLLGIVDIFLPDFKYGIAEIAGKYSGAVDYLQNAVAAIKEMHRQVGDMQFDESGSAKKGVLIRHLILPGNTENSMSVLREIKAAIGTDVYISLMSQYFPAYKALNMDINRGIRKDEYNEIVEYFFYLGFKNGYLQG